MVRRRQGPHQARHLQHRERLIAQDNGVPNDFSSGGLFHSRQIEEAGLGAERDEQMT